MKTSRREKRWEEKLYCANVAIYGKKSIRDLTKNCVNVLTCGQISYECTNGTFKETYG